MSFVSLFRPRLERGFSHLPPFDRPAMLNSFALQLGSFVIYLGVLAGSIWIGVSVSRLSGRPWIGVATFAALFLGGSILLALGGSPAPGGFSSDD